MADVATLVDRLRTSRKTTVLTGAGISAASGVPTFRSTGGLWRQFRAEDLATPDAFHRDPALVWEWYDWRRQKIAACEPNPAHRILASWSRRLPGFAVITQNVDGLHERAGTADVMRLHGSIWRVRCTRPCRHSASRDERRTPLPHLPPQCECGALLRPDVVWFGEQLDPAIIDRASELTACDLFLTIGTSSLVYPAAGLVHEARAHAAYTVEINPDITDASPHVDLGLRGPAETVLADVERGLEAAS
jgi:NAD-dependent deacetylase